MEIYILIDNQPQGPYTTELIRQYLKSGELQPEDLAAYAGSADWKPLGSMVQSCGTPPQRKGARFVRGSAAGTQRSKGALGLALTGCILLLLVGVGGFVWWKVFGTNGAGAKVVTPAEPGLPNTLAELNAWYAEPPEGQNAATFILKGFDAMQITNADYNSTDLPILGKGMWPALGSPLPLKSKIAIATLMQRNKVALEAFHQAASFEQARYPIDWNQGYDTPLPHLYKLKRATQLGCLTSSLLADNKQPQPATDILLTSLACAQSLKYEPVLISQIVRLMCLGIVATNLERVVNSVALSPSELERLAATFAKAEAEESRGIAFRRSCVGERACCLAVFDLPVVKMEAMVREIASVRTNESGASPIQSLAIENLTGNLKSQRAFVEKTFNRFIVMSKQSFPEQLNAEQYFTSRVAEAKSNQFDLCVLLMPPLSDYLGKEAAGLAELRLAQTAIALERYRAANNSLYPTTLTELVPKYLPAVPQDPFDGEPLRYKKNGEGYELSSIGADPTKPVSFKVIKPPKISSASTVAAR